MRIRGRNPAMALTEDEPPTALPRMHLNATVPGAWIGPSVS